MFNWSRVRTVLLGILLIVVGAVQVLSLHFSGMEVIIGILAIIDGILWLL
jgi:uncharacterized membrane protein HdeD (DUF308 family)